MNKYLIIGGGFILQKHLDAIKKSGSKVEFIHNRSDSIGIIGNYFNDAKYLKKVGDSFLEHYKNKLIPVIINSTDQHYKWLKRLIKAGYKKIIVEKPPVSNISQLKKIIKLAELYNAKIYPVLQMRYSQNNKKTGEMIKKSKVIEISYKTPRGLWYNSTWKADKKKSGGFLLNIGIHIIDFILLYIGEENVSIKKKVKDSEALIIFKQKNKIVKLYLSIKKEVEAERTLFVDNKLYNLEFSHYDFYKEFKKGKVYNLDKTMISRYKITKM